MYTRMLAHPYPCPSQLGGKMPTTTPKMSMRSFYAGQHVFMTGVSGFVGKVVLQKILSDLPDVECVYLLIRPKRGVVPHPLASLLHQR